MNEKVRQYLVAKQSQERKLRDEHLIELGLFEKQYNPFDKYDPQYPDYEWDERSSSNRYYRKVPCPVTDQEYAYIKRYEDMDTGKTNGTNTVASILTGIAWVIYIVGFFAGFYFGTIEISDFWGYSEHEFSFAIAIVYWSVTLVSGSIFLGFAEIIKLLQAIKDK